MSAAGDGSAGVDGGVGGGAGVLVVEDDLDNATLMAHWLQAAGLRVRHAITGEAALVECGRALPRVVVLDVNLPGIDGLEVLRRLRAEPAWAGLPVVVTSIETAQDHRLGGDDHRVDAWLVKPFASRQLLHAVRDALARPGPTGAPDGPPPGAPGRAPTDGSIVRPPRARDLGQGLP